MGDVTKIEPERELHREDGTSTGVKVTEPEIKVPTALDYIAGTRMLLELAECEFDLRLVHQFREGKSRWTLEVEAGGVTGDEMSVVFEQANKRGLPCKFNVNGRLVIG